MPALNTIPLLKALYTLQDLAEHEEATAQTDPRDAHRFLAKGYREAYTLLEKAYGESGLALVPREIVFYDPLAGTPYVPPAPPAKEQRRAYTRR